MELERLSSNKIKYSISFEELTFKGFTEDEMLKESEIWDDLFDEMLDEASRVYALEPCEAVAIEIYSMTSKELVLILTLDEDDFNDSAMERPPSLIDNNFIIVVFENIDDCISFAKKLNTVNRFHSISSLYSFNSHYYFVIAQDGFKQETLLALSEEYGRLSSISLIYLEEYGKRLIDKTAIQTFHSFF
ncbi:adaptor protein MecA [Bacillus niameyensis]|uniref:adaptor protein MecA n=1 Tax=Bacillus niameyensis TaxID=1522308 RepID=UPI00078343DD|nr:adaptor protein MecA [Bacillus niameyensis]